MRARRPNFRAYYFVAASGTGIGAIIMLAALAEQNLIGKTVLMYLATIVIAVMIVAGIGITVALLRGGPDASRNDTVE